MYLPRSSPQCKSIYAHVNDEENNAVKEVTINHEHNLIHSVDMPSFSFYFQLQYLINEVKKKVAKWYMVFLFLKLTWQLLKCPVSQQQSIQSPHNGTLIQRYKPVTWW